MADRSIEILGSGAEPYIQPPADQALFFTGLATTQALGSAIIAGPIILTGIATSEAIGSHSLLTPIVFDGLASNEAIGTAQVNLNVVLTGIPTSEALGTLDIAQLVVLAGIPSAEAIGTATIALLVGSLTGLASNEVIGTAQVDMHVSLTGMSTAEAIGTAHVAQAVSLTGLTTNEIIGSHEVKFLIGPLDGLASSEAIGTARIDMSVALTGVPTSAALGDEIIAGPLILYGLPIPSDEALGNLQVAMSIALTGLPTSEAIGSFGTSRTVALWGLPSVAQIGISRLVFDQNVVLPSVSLGPVVSFHRVAVDGGYIAGGEANKSGPTTGGKHITLIAPGLDMASVEDTFSTSLNLALWSSVTAGSGRVVVIPGYPRGTLHLSTGLEAASSAFIRSTTLTDRSDVQVDFTLTPHFRNGVAAASASLGLYVSPTTYFRALIETSRGLSFLRIRGMENGIEHINVLLPVVGITALRLRVLRNKEMVYVLLNDSMVWKATWTSVEASIEIGVTGDTLGLASMTATVTKYVRNPVILFGGEPMMEVLFKTQDRLDGLTPPHTKGTVTIHMETAASEFDLDETYEYVPAIDYRRVGVAGDSELAATTDVTVRN